MSKQKPKRLTKQRWLEDRRFRALIESSPDGISLLDAEGRTVYVSPSITRILGYTRDELMGIASFDLAHPEDLRPTRLIFAELVRQPGSTAQALIRLRHKNGPWRWTEVWGRNLLHEPDIAAIVVNYRDVTERKEAEEENREIERRLRLAMEGGRMGAWEADLQTGEVRWFLKSETHFGLPEGKTSWPLEKFFELLHPDDRERIREEFSRSIARQVNHESEFRIVWPDGSVHWLFGLGQPIPDTTGRVARVYGVGRDITAQKQAEEALQESERRATGLLNAITESIMLIDLEGGILAVNSSMASRLGGTVDQILGQNVYALLPPEVAQGRRARADEVIRSAKAIRFQDQRGDTVLDSHVYPLLDADGRVTGLVVFAVDITERKRAEQALRDSEQRSQALAAATFEGIAVTENARYVDANEPLTKMLGYASHELIGLSVADTVAPEDLDRVLVNIRAGRESVVEHDMLRKDGSRLTVEAHGRTVVYQGRPVRFTAIRDITQRKQSEAALRESERRLRLAMDGARMSIWEMDLQTNTARWSDQAARLFGLPGRAFEAPREEFLNKVHPDDLADITRRFRRAVEEGEDYEAEFRVIWPDGSEHWLHVLGRALHGASGQPQRVSGVVREVTERKRAEQALRQTEELYRSIVETAEEGIWLVDREWRVTFVNQRLTQMLGYTAEEMKGRHITEFMEEEERRVAPAHMRLRELGQRSTHDSRLRRKDGSVLWAIVAGNPLLDEECRFTGALALIADITDRKEAEEKLRESAEALEALSRRLLAVQETERQALARELHDEVGQSLTLLKLTVDRCRQADPAEVQFRLEETQGMLGDLVRRVRNMSLDLRPSMLDDLGLLPALLWQFDRYRAQTQIEVLFTQTGLEGRRLGTQVETAAFRIVQEALTNVARHAGVHTVSVRVVAEAEILRVQVQDGGRGFDVAAALRAGASVGLRGMSERARLLGGRLDINSDPAAGTFLTAEIPLRPLSG